jgi:hypothetical protein
MTILNQHTSRIERITTLTIASCAMGFITGFFLSLMLAAYSLYSCIEMR